MSNILELRGVEKRFDGFYLDKVSFKLPEGFIMGFIGPNGAGKTTTIKLILGMLNLDGGEIRLFGQERGSRGDERSGEIGVVLDSPFFVGDWRLRDVERAISPFYKEWDGEKYKKLLREFSLDPKKKVKELSRGMSMKLMIAAALSHNARLLILDEPTSGLDAVARDELMDILSGFISDAGRGVLFSTHITADLEKTADYITFINKGKILYSGTKDNLLESYRVVKGGLGDLNAELRKSVIGIREHQAGFDGLMESSKLGMLPRNAVAEPASLDEILVRINKEGKVNA